MQLTEQQRVVTAVVACMAILFVWQFFFSPPPPHEEPVAQRGAKNIPGKGEAIEANDAKPNRPTHCDPESARS